MLQFKCFFIKPIYPSVIKQMDYLVDNTITGSFFKRAIEENTIYVVEFHYYIGLVVLYLLFSSFTFPFWENSLQNRVSIYSCYFLYPNQLFRVASRNVDSSSLSVVRHRIQINLSCSIFAISINIYFYGGIIINKAFHTESLIHYKFTIAK